MSGDEADAARPGDEAVPVSECWLVRDGRVLSSLEIPQGRKAKAKGLLGRPDFDGAILLRGVRSVHSVGMQFDLDVALLDADNVVIKTIRLHRNRVTAPMWRAKAVLEAEAGAFGDWELKIGDELEIRE
ncbi:MAG: DUF192 domain-containing protein [Acidimicrobiales bacterium]